ncbi:MAG TPA: nickel pincer cofactor biosynthesis protein LarB [Thermosulfurimonas dismutans]|uniref:Nickel pincer cofactor biosynthesis protein LarB n=1 Tax=Thermosulfurimonas dismutans TaxID=999894 RepID=A0A7C3CKD4_9BACT|nr:nickel pincer cofactor biosynthesis protein LarB [Thermosulfurimonas dismutans]
MIRQRLRRILEEVREGRLSVSQAEKLLEGLPFEELETVKLDHHRGIRKHFPEIIYGPGKTEEELLRIVESFLEKDLPLLITRISPDRARRLRERFPQLEYHERAALLGRRLPGPRVGQILVVSGGTADLPVAEEARVAAEYFGNRVDTLYDVGVAGVHRLLSYREKLLAARVLIAVAGMEGALPSLVAGLVDRPVIAVPTSVGYGAHFGGLAPLLAMLNTCAPGVAVVNIDNGVGAAYFASIINQLPEKITQVEKTYGQTGT